MPGTSSAASARRRDTCDLPGIGRRHRLRGGRRRRTADMSPQALARARAVRPRSSRPARSAARRRSCSTVAPSASVRRRKRGPNGRRSGGSGPRSGPSSGCDRRASRRRSATAHKTRPAGTAIELRLRREERERAADAVVGALGELDDRAGSSRPASVPSWRSTSYCSGDRRRRHSASRVGHPGGRSGKGAALHRRERGGGRERRQESCLGSSCIDHNARGADFDVSRLTRPPAQAAAPGRRRRRACRNPPSCAAKKRASSRSN